MASIQKTANGYRAQIKIAGVRDSKVLPTRREASLWAVRRESEIRDNLSKPAGELNTLQQALQRYAKEVSPTKRGRRWEQIRLMAFERDALPLDLPIAQVTAQHLADFRDSRSTKVSDGTVLRELTLLSAVFETARREWGWIETNPCRAIRKPPSPRHRERIISGVEVRKMLRVMGYQKEGRLRSTGQAVAVCMLTALCTGMRAGELCNLSWEDVFERHVRLPMTKNGKPRDVPLSTTARHLISRMKGWDDALVFGLNAGSLSSLFRKYRTRAGLDGFTFHDTRHTAATRLARKVDVLTLCKIFGWSNTAQALTYYNPKASDIAELLA